MNIESRLRKRRLTGILAGKWLVLAALLFMSSAIGGPVVATPTEQGDDSGAAESLGPTAEPEALIGMGLSADVWIGENTVVVSVDGTSTAVAPGGYIVEVAELPELHLTPVAGGDPVTVVAEQIETSPANQPGSAYLGEDGEDPFIFFTADTGESFRIPVKVSELRTRSIYVVPKPDLRISMSGPNVHYSPVANTWRVRVYSDAVATSNVKFMIHLCNVKGPSLMLRSCIKLVSVSGASCSIVETDPGGEWDKSYTLHCTVSSIARNSVADVMLNMKWVTGKPSTGWGSRYTLRPRVDPGRVIRESNEYNNTGIAAFTIHRKTDLRAVLNETTMVRGRNNTRSFRVTNPGSYSVSGVTAVLSVPGFYIASARPTSSTAGFSCTFSNSTSKVTCSGGRMGGSVTSTEFSVALRAKSSTPDLTPVILQVDPGRRISEESETNNIVTKNFRLCNTGRSSGYCY